MTQDKLTPLKSGESGFLPEEPLGESLLSLSGPSVRVWQPKSTVIVLGRSQKAEIEVNLQTAGADNIPIFKRHGGGGCVVLDENSVCVGIRYDREGSEINISDFLKHSTECVRLFLKETYQLNVEIMENYDLLLDGRKFLGSSLYMPKGLCLYLAVILIKKQALEKINRYLPLPSKIPDHRQQRSHDEFLIPLEDYIDDNITAFIKKFEEFIAETDWVSGPYG